MAGPNEWFRRVTPAGSREQFLKTVNRFRGMFLPEPYCSVLPYTMVGLKRLKLLNRLVHRIDEIRIAGDVVECGTCNGGSGAILAQVACRSPMARHTWLMDSFEGLPFPGEHDGAQATEYVQLCRGSEEQVRLILKRTGVGEDAVTLVKGWFEQTVPMLPAHKIALLHIDADWYESVRVVLEHLYERVVPDGFVVIDDYGYWQGCRRAVDEFLSCREIDVSLIDIDRIGAYFQKPRSLIG
jgi:O-methyltransferase